jgi:hypothetical protein
VINAVTRAMNDLRKEVLQEVEKSVKCNVPDKYCIAVTLSVDSAFINIEVRYL